MTVAPLDSWELLKDRLSPKRFERIHNVIENRTDYIRLVVQDIHNPHNVSACLRSADAFGVQNVDVVTLSESKYRETTVAKGVTGWLTLTPYAEVERCAKKLKSDGYALVTGMPSQNALPLSELPLDRPLAVIFGNEHEGVHESWKPHIDHEFTIPMVGMVESLNISVSAAITMQRMTERAKAEKRDSYYLSPEVKKSLLNEWVYRQFNKNDELLQQLRADSISK